MDRTLSLSNIVANDGRGGADAEEGGEGDGDGVDLHVCWLFLFESGGDDSLFRVCKRIRIGYLVSC